MPRKAQHYHWMQAEIYNTIHGITYILKDFLHVLLVFKCDKPISVQR